MGWNEWIVLILLLLLVVMIFAIVDLMKSQFTNPAIKLLYLILIIFFPLFGTIIYYTSAAQFKNK
jgi:type II secretory pathway component PulF